MTTYGARRDVPVPKGLPPLDRALAHTYKRLCLVTKDYTWQASSVAVSEFVKPDLLAFIYMRYEQRGSNGLTYFVDDSQTLVARLYDRLGADYLTVNGRFFRNCIIDGVFSRQLARSIDGGAPPFAITEKYQEVVKP